MLMKSEFKLEFDVAWADRVQASGIDLTESAQTDVKLFGMNANPQIQIDNIRVVSPDTPFELSYPKGLCFRCSHHRLFHQKNGCVVKLMVAGYENFASLPACGCREVVQ